VPVVLMNGALLYDMAARRFVQKSVLPAEVVREIIGHMEDCGQSGFFYSLRGECIRPHHLPLTRPGLLMFRQLRLEIYGKEFVETADLRAHAGDDIVYFTTNDRREALEPLYERLRTLPGLTSVLYTDAYQPGNWYLECLSAAASKRYAAEFLRRSCAFGRLAGFGDNLNDLPLFAASDERYAVANAQPELKAQADRVIGPHTEDGVARFLLERVQATRD
jgi:hydroxymethylpyrimidine pyrophosphatase-like HAD family hydrolase